jgi:hypothetical protein
MNAVRNLRVLGLSALALLAISGVSASPAQAGTFEAGVYPATVTGQEINGPHEFTTELGTMACAVKFGGVLEAAGAALTVTPQFTNCVINGNEVDATSNGCHFRIGAGATLFMDMVEGSLDVVCPAGKQIEFGITVEEEEGCQLEIPEQLGLGEVTLINTTMAQDLDVEFNIEGMSYELGPTCPEVGLFENGQYLGESTLRAHNEGMGTSLGVK